MAHDLGAFGLPKTLVSRHMPWAQEFRLPEEDIRQFRGGVTVPLKRLKEEYLEQDGVRFLMEDEAGRPSPAGSATKRCEIMPTACTSQVPTPLFSTLTAS